MSSGGAGILVPVPHSYYSNAELKELLIGKWKGEFILVSLVLVSNMQRVRNFASKFYSSKVSAKTKQPLSTLEYCIDLLKKNDYEGFLSTLLIPNPRTRRGVFAIKAFNSEVALVRDHVKVPQIGLGRLAFWRDAIVHLFKSQTSITKNGLPYSSLPRHPVILELSREVMQTNVSRKWFSNLVESREEIMSDAPFPTLEHLEKYSDKSVTPTLYLAFEFIGVKSVELDHAASHLGKAIGLGNFIRGLPYNSKHRRVLVPQELLLKHKLSQESFIRVDEVDKIQNLVFDIASVAFAHYQKAKALEPVILKDLKASDQLKLDPLSIFITGLPTKIYLNRLEKHEFNPYHPSLNKRYGPLPFHLYYNKLRKRFY